MVDDIYTRERVRGWAHCYIEALCTKTCKPSHIAIQRGACVQVVMNVCRPSSCELLSPAVHVITSAEEVLFLLLSLGFISTLLIILTFDIAALVFFI